MISRRSPTVNGHSLGRQWIIACRFIGVWVDRRGITFDLGPHRWSYYRRGVWVPFGIRQTPEGRLGRFVHSRNPNFVPR